MHRTDRILSDIQSLESQASAFNARGMANALQDILFDLLTEEQYTINILDTDPATSDLPFDAIGKSETGDSIGVGFRIVVSDRPIGQYDALRLPWQVTAGIYSKVCIATNSHFSKECYDSIANAPFAIELLDLRFLKDWAKRLRYEALTQAKKEYVEITKALTNLFVARIVANPLFLSQLEWREVEKLVADLFNGLGFMVTLTPPGKDGGKDVILEYRISGETRSCIVEVKHWRSSSKVGEKKVKSFVEVVVSEKHDSGLFLSTYGFTHSAFASLTEIERCRLRVGSKQKIYSLCRTYLKAKEGLWMPPDTLEPTLYEETSSI